MTLAHFRLCAYKPQEQGFNGEQDQIHNWPKSKINSYSLLQRLSMDCTIEFIPQASGEPIKPASEGTVQTELTVPDLQRESDIFLLL